VRLRLRRGSSRINDCRPSQCQDANDNRGSDQFLHDKLLTLIRRPDTAQQSRRIHGGDIRADAIRNESRPAMGGPT
jgi:hypothetical protein